MKQQSITTLPPSPEAERRSRMIKYTIAMSIRVACIFAMLFAQGWWLVVFAAGAIFLPYVAVVLANVSGPSRDSEVLRPGGLVPTGPQRPVPPRSRRPIPARSRHPPPRGRNPVMLPRPPPTTPPPATPPTARARGRRTTSAVPRDRRHRGGRRPRRLLARRVP